MRKWITILSLSIAFLFSCRNENIEPIESAKGKPQGPEPVCILLDFDGHEFYAGCAATEDDKKVIIDSSEKYLARWVVRFTTDKNIYDSFTKKWVVAFSDSPVGFLGFTPLGGMINGSGSYSVVWYYGAVNNIAPVNYRVQLARLLTHEFAHALGVVHGQSGIMKAYPFGVGDVFFTGSDIRVIDKIIKRRR